MSSCASHICPKTKLISFSLYCQKPYFFMLPGTIFHHPIRDNVLWIASLSHCTSAAVASLTWIVHWYLNWPFCHNCLILFLILRIATEVSLNETRFYCVLALLVVNVSFDPSLALGTYILLMKCLLTWGKKLSCHQIAFQLTQRCFSLPIPFIAIHITTLFLLSVT